MLETPLTTTGAEPSAFGPAPSWPALLPPQHDALPSECLPHACPPPFTSSTMPDTPSNTRGVGPSLDGMAPSPQQLTVPFDMRAQTSRDPAAICVAPNSPSTLTGVGHTSDAHAEP